MGMRQTRFLLSSAGPLRITWLRLSPAPALPVPKNPQTSGLDAAQDLARDERHGDDEVVDDLLALAGKAKRGLAPAEKPEQPEKPSKGLGAVLVGKAKALEEDKKEKLKRKLEKKRSRHDEDDDVGRLARRKRRSIKDSDSDGEGSTDSEPGFRVASSREVDLVQMSKKDPGCLLRSALKEMSRYLAARGEANRDDPLQGKVVSYLHQILLRELITLASSLDLLLEGELGRVGDLLLQRFKAIEASLAADGNWMVARHQELIPGQASLSTKAELTEAARAELRAQKLRQQMSKGGGGPQKST